MLRRRRQYELCARYYVNDDLPIWKAALKAGIHHDRANAEKNAWKLQHKDYFTEEVQRLQQIMDKELAKVAALTKDEKLQSIKNLDRVLQDQIDAIVEDKKIDPATKAKIIGNLAKSQTTVGTRGDKIQGHHVKEKENLENIEIEEMKRLFRKANEEKQKEIKTATLADQYLES